MSDQSNERPDLLAKPIDNNIAETFLNNLEKGFENESNGGSIVSIGLYESPAEPEANNTLVGVAQFRSPQQRELKELFATELFRIAVNDPGSTMEQWLW